MSSYSNYGTALAGALVATVENTPWQDLIERDILLPMNLAHTSGREPYPARPICRRRWRQRLAQDVSTPFSWNGVAHVAAKFEFVTQAAPAGAISASAADIARYMLLLLGDGTLDGVTVFGPTAARAFRTPQTSLPPGVGALDGGFFDTVLPGGFHGYGHGGATMAFFSSMVVVPELDLGIFATTNTDGGGAVSNALPGRIIEHFYASPRSAPEGPAPELVGTSRVYAGDYVSTRRRNEGLEGFLTRFANAMSVSVTSEGFLLVSGSALRSAMCLPANPTCSGPPQGRPARAAGCVSSATATGDRVVAMPVAFERAGPLHRPMTFGLAAGLASFAATGILIGSFLRLRRRMAESDGRDSRDVLSRRSCALARRCRGVRAVDHGSDGGCHGSVPQLARGAAHDGILCGADGDRVDAVWRVAPTRSVASSPDSRDWTFWRRSRYTAAVAIFAAFGILLGAWGALAPWAS